MHPDGRPEWKRGTSHHAREINRMRAIAADKIWTDIDTILTAAERNGTTGRLKTVAIYFSAEELTIMREALNEASNRWYSADNAEPR